MKRNIPHIENKGTKREKDGQEEVPVSKKTNTGAYGIRTLDIYYSFIEEHKSGFLKTGTVRVDTKAENLGLARQLSGFHNLQDMEEEMNDILLGEKIELYTCCLF